jgi:cytochrome b561
MNQGYRWPLVGLHWLTLLLIVTAYLIGNQMGDMDTSPLKLKLFSWHKWLGITVLFLLPLRLLLRLSDRLDHAAGLLPWEARASAAVHGALYLLMLVAPMLGWLYSSASGFPVVWFGVLSLPDLVAKDKALAHLLKELHEISVNSLAALVALHAAAALYHQHIRHDGVLARMVPWMRSKP